MLTTMQTTQPETELDAALALYEETIARFPPDLIDIHIDEEEGLFVATSPQFAEILVAHPSLDAIYADMPAVIAAIYRGRYGQDVFVCRGSRPPGVESNAFATTWVVHSRTVPGRAVA